MSNPLYSQLAWLPAAPEDFSAQCRQLLDDRSDLGEHLQRLANHALDENQLNRLAKVVRKARDAGHSLAPLTPFRIGLISNATSHFIVPPLVASAARYGIALECIEANYDQAMQVALSPDSIINQAQCDAVLVAIDHRGLPLNATPGDAQAAQVRVQAALAHLNMIRDGLRSNSNAICILQTLPRPVESSFGNFDLALPGTPRQLVDEINRGIALSVAGTEDLLLDVAHIADTVGLADWHDPTLWNMAKLPFASSFLPLYADHVCRLIGGAARQEPQVPGARSGQHAVGRRDRRRRAGGHRHRPGRRRRRGPPAVQRTALALRERGVVLAVSSKNNGRDRTPALPRASRDAAARRPHRGVPGQLERQGDQHQGDRRRRCRSGSIRWCSSTTTRSSANWCASCCRRWPCPNCRHDPALYARTLLAAGYFEAVAFSAEDRKRAEFYQDNARRADAGEAGGRPRRLSRLARHGRSTCSPSTTPDAHASRSSSTNRTSST